MVLSEKDLKHLSEVSKISLKNFDIDQLQDMLYILEEFKHIDIPPNTEPFISPAHEDLSNISFKQLRVDEPNILIAATVKEPYYFYVPKIISDPWDKDL